MVDANDRSAAVAKKSWHTANINNQEKVWLAEQEKEKEAKRLELLKKQVPGAQHPLDPLSPYLSLSLSRFPASWFSFIRTRLCRKNAGGMCRAPVIGLDA